MCYNIYKGEKKMESYNKTGDMIPELKDLETVFKKLVLLNERVHFVCGVSIIKEGKDGKLDTDNSRTDWMVYGKQGLLLLMNDILREGIMTEVDEDGMVMI